MSKPEVANIIPFFESRFQSDDLDFLLTLTDKPKTKELLNIDQSVITRARQIEAVTLELSDQCLRETAVARVVLDALCEQVIRRKYKVTFKVDAQVPFIAGYNNKGRVRIHAPQQLEQAMRCQTLVDLYDFPGHGTERDSFLITKDYTFGNTPRSYTIMHPSKYEALACTIAGFIELDHKSHETTDGAAI